VLTKISLTRNRIGLTGAVALADSLRVNTGLRELGLGRNNVGNKGAVTIAGALRRNETLEWLDLSSNSISDEGAMAMLKTLMESNCSLTWLNLEENAAFSPGLQSHIEFVLASRRVLKSFRECLCKPMDKKVLPLVIQCVKLKPICHENPELVHSQETAAGPILLLVRAAALNDSRVIKAAPPSCGGLT
jgi:Leucine Rich repeat